MEFWTPNLQDPRFLGRKWNQQSHRKLEEIGCLRDRDRVLVQIRTCFEKVYVNLLRTDTGIANDQLLSRWISEIKQ
jgi:hypothetical protein